jgi:hypothetical protein
MSDTEDQIKKAITEKNLTEISDAAFKEFLLKEKERNAESDHKFFEELEKSSFFKGMYDQAFRAGIVKGVQLLTEVLKQEQQ